ncbi:hypothetical protein CJ030_MR5G024637 [Morella rubra]|uniref:Uncharacterized protein n=1 Tax=Morella rubra TaxID=262757 RepID=A0A6A1VHK0_9ROSI|nr:hypothetical protein CJ030_MR5G024637 [Morella rubra]
MGWNHPDITLEEMAKLTKVPVDILILASGYQSSGRLAHWDSQNIKKTFQWGLFFECVFSLLISSDVYRDSVKELDAALSEMTSNSSFPQGLTHLSCNALTKGRVFVLEHLIHASPLRDAHLRALMTAIVEMDLYELSQTEHNCLNVYMNKLTLHHTLLVSVPDSRSFVKDNVIPSPGVAQIKNIKNDSGDDFTKYAVQEILKSQCAVSCISTVETGLDVLLNTIRNRCDSDNNLLKKQLKHEKNPELLLEFITWNCWKSRNLSYFLDKRTVRLVSGASLIFSAAKAQWLQVLQGLNISAKNSDGDFSETVDFYPPLGQARFWSYMVVCRWNGVIEHFLFLPYGSLAIPEQYEAVCNFILRRSKNFDSREEVMNSKTFVIIRAEVGDFEDIFALKAGPPLKKNPETLDWTNILAVDAHPRKILSRMLEPQDLEA